MNTRAHHSLAGRTSGMVDMSNEQAKDQDKLKREELIKEAMRQASEDQRKVMDKWTANAQDSNKIYWKG